MDCLGCERCETGSMVTLVNGNAVCNYCPSWLLECEARYLLTLPLKERRTALERREKRGRDVTELKDIMIQVHAIKAAAK